MNAENVDQVRVRRCARPLSLTAGNRRVALLIHGYTGYPGELAFPGKILFDAGWDVRIPRLTGHGTSGADFAGTGLSMWRRQVADEYLNLNSVYEEVVVIGHSMGGLLALDLAIRFPVPSVVVLAPAIGIRNRGQFLVRPISLLFRRRAVAWKPDPAYRFFDDRDDDDDMFLGKEYWSWAWFKPLADLLKLQAATGRNLKSISGQVLGIFGELDGIVGNGGRRLLKSELKSGYTEAVLPGCGHYIPYDPNPGSKETAMEITLDWLKDRRK